MGEQPATRRYLVHAYGPDRDALKNGFRWLWSAAVLANGGAVFVETLGHLDQLAPVIRQDQARRARKDKRFSWRGAEIELFTARAIPGRYDKPILVLWPDDARLRAIEAAHIPDLCVVAWDEGVIREWIQDHSPESYPHTENVVAASEEAEAPTEQRIISNPVIEEAMKSLTARVNLSSGISHVLDRPAAITMFKILRDGGEAYVPAEIRTWAVNNGWEDRYAKDLEEVSQKILGGRRLQDRGRGGWRPDILEYWRSEAVAQPDDSPTETEDETD